MSVLGGVEVAGATDIPLLLPLPPYRTLEDAVAGLGARIVDNVANDTPLVVVGDSAAHADHPFAVRTTFHGWSGGIVPLNGDGGLAERQEFVPAGVFAGALAIAEVFQHLRGNQPMAGRRQTGLSLWRPELDWRDAGAVGPGVERLPSAMWLIGLGNLGQVYLWTMGPLPYAVPGEVELVLQDFDVLAESNESTSLLTHRGLIGTRKTRAMAAWAEGRGFKTAVVERPFAANFRVGSDEPAVALCGVDNALARSALEDVGFERVFEAGLGGGTNDFLGFRTHVLPGSHAARDLWSSGGEKNKVRIDLPAYRALAAEGIDRCGLTQLAGRTVGAPFVGAIAATIVISELVRLVNGGHSYDLVDGHLRNLDYRTVITARKSLPVNPGSTVASS